jgi:hypothetical protein
VVPLLLCKAPPQAVGELKMRAFLLIMLLTPQILLAQDKLTSEQLLAHGSNSGGGGNDILPTFKSTGNELLGLIYRKDKQILSSELGINIATLEFSIAQSELNCATAAELPDMRDKMELGRVATGNGFGRIKLDCEKISKMDFSKPSSRSFVLHEYLRATGTWNNQLENSYQQSGKLSQLLASSVSKKFAVVGKRSDVEEAFNLYIYSTPEVVIKTKIVALPQKVKARVDGEATVGAIINSILGSHVDVIGGISVGLEVTDPYLVTVEIIPLVDGKNEIELKKFTYDPGRDYNNVRLCAKPDAKPKRLDSIYDNYYGQNCSESACKDGYYFNWERAVDSYSKAFDRCTRAKYHLESLSDTQSQIVFRAECKPTTVSPSVLKDFWGIGWCRPLRLPEINATIRF